TVEVGLVTDGGAAHNLLCVHWPHDEGQQQACDQSLGHLSAPFFHCRLHYCCTIGQCSAVAAELSTVFCALSVTACPGGDRQPVQVCTLLPEACNMRANGCASTDAARLVQERG